MAEYKQSFKYGETVYLLNIADTGVPIIRELVITDRKSTRLNSSHRL